MSLVSTVNVRTPDLRRAVADYTGVLGFGCLQHIPGVCALVAVGSLRVLLWACGAPPGRWERPTPGDRGFAPGHHRVEVANVHELHARLRAAVLRPGHTGLAGRKRLHAHRVDAEAPCWQPWGAWECTVIDVDGNVLHLIDHQPRRSDGPTKRLPGDRRVENRS